MCAYSGHDHTNFREYVWSVGVSGGVGDSMSGGMSGKLSCEGRGRVSCGRNGVVKGVVYGVGVSCGVGGGELYKFLRA